MKNDLRQSQNDIEELRDLNDLAYENIFKMHKDEDTYYAFNISKTVSIPGDIDDNFVDYVRINGKISWTQLSFRYYGTISLWWLICLTNGIMNPVLLPDPGSTLKIIKRERVSDVINSIKNNNV